MCVSDRVLAGDHLLVRDQVVVALDVLALGAEPGPTFAGETRECDVHVVRCATHDADGQLGDSTQPSVSTFEIVDRARDHVADVDGLACFRVGHQAIVRELVLASNTAARLCAAPSS